MGVLGGTAALGVGAASVSLDGWTIQTGLLDAGPWALLIGVVAFIFYGVFKGWIVPKPHYDTLMERALAAEAANEKLSERAAKLTETNSVQARAIETQTAVGDTMTKLINAIQDARSSAGGTA